MALQRVKMNMTNTRIIALSFAIVILVGALLLCTPFASASGSWTNPVDALFTATTATCVTGLVVVDTSAHWSLFGQIVILILIQLGGIGFMTLITLFSFFVHRQVSLHERRLLLQSVGSLQMGSVMATFRQILIGTFLMEGLGAALLSIRFYPMYGKKGIWYAVFHSISAFCNAGIDVLGAEGSASLTAFRNDPLVSGVIMLLIVMGGLGFLVWDDLMRNFFRPRRLRLHTKMVLCATVALLLGGWVLLYVTEYDHAFAGMGQGERLMASLFQSVTLRTAGFAAVDQAALGEGTRLFSMILMFIGGNSGSTAGGIKISTLAIVGASTVSIIRGERDTVLRKRRIDNDTVRRAYALFAIGIIVVAAGGFALSALEGASLSDSFFEVFSAFGTVGITVGITPSLSVAGKLLIISLMFFGRIGITSVMYAVMVRTNREKPPVSYPRMGMPVG